MSKNKIKNKRKAGFSLVELSIVLLIIGIVVAGVVAGSQLIQAGKLTGARLLTESSPVPRIADLKFWIEPSRKASFDNVRPRDGDTISTWFDTNPVSQRRVDLDVVEGTPSYRERGIGGLPSIFFDANAAGSSGESLSSTENEPLTGVSEYTIFIVMQPEEITSSTDEYFLQASVTNTSGYYFSNRHGSDEVRMFTRDGALNVTQTHSPVAANAPAIITGFFDNDGNISLSRNGATPDITAVTNSYVANTSASNTSLFLGRTGVVGIGRYDGLFSEVIMYSRALDSDEIDLVEEYLSVKYDIAVN